MNAPRLAACRIWYPSAVRPALSVQLRSISLAVSLVIWALSGSGGATGMAGAWRRWSWPSRPRVDGPDAVGGRRSCPGASPVNESVKELGLAGETG